MTETPHEVASELKAIAADTRELLAETKEGLGNAIDNVRHAGHSAFVKLRRTGRAVGQPTADSTRIAARATRQYVQQSPWRAVGIAVVVAATLAYVLRRR
jgi:ElaB/YqjD/DUF883 family membrane-anchored ribosome-binding protein